MVEAYVFSCPRLRRGERERNIVYFISDCDREGCLLWGGYVVVVLDREARCVWGKFVYGVYYGTTIEVSREVSPHLVPDYISAVIHCPYASEEEKRRAEQIIDTIMSIF